VQASPRHSRGGRISAAHPPHVALVDAPCQACPPYLDSLASPTLASIQPCPPEEGSDSFFYGNVDATSEALSCRADKRSASAAHRVGGCALQAYPPYLDGLASPTLASTQSCPPEEGADYFFYGNVDATSEALSCRADKRSASAAHRVGGCALQAYPPYLDGPASTTLASTQSCPPEEGGDYFFFGMYRSVIVPS
jgi:hypothetical protein